mmetsp:Transcript_91207/g.295005  ORF Transcript_91207/g.295005 Transcript_91207/m.295005 type:complete len:204 (+) Transcript_91207:1311-1922(+)
MFSISRERPRGSRTASHWRSLRLGAMPSARRSARGCPEPSATMPEPGFSMSSSSAKPASLQLVPNVTASRKPGSNSLATRSMCPRLTATTRVATATMSPASTSSTCGIRGMPSIRRGPTCAVATPTSRASTWTRTTRPSGRALPARGCATRVRRHALRTAPPKKSSRRGVMPSATRSVSGCHACSRTLHETRWSANARPTGRA